MFRNYFKTTFRKLIKDKRYTLINIAGLSTGLILFLTIALYVQRELNVDKHQPDWENIYRVNAAYTSSEGNTDVYAVTYQPLAEAMESDLPEIEAATNFFSPAAQLSFRSDDQMLSIDNTLIYYTANSFFEVFTHDWVDQGQLLNAPNTVVISDKLAARFFGKEDAIGQTLTYEDPQQTLTLTVSGIFKSTQAPSHIAYEMLISDESSINFWRQGLADNWNLQYVYTYFKVANRTSTMALNEKLGIIREKYQAEGDRLAYQAQPLGNIYWNATFFEPGVNGNISYIYVFGTFALVVLLLAGVNFINLMTARSIRRSKEVAIRKIVGANKRGLIFQYLLESIALAMISMVVAGVSVERLIPVINANFDLQIAFNLFDNGALLIMVVLVPLVLGFVSGIYPALVLSSFKANNILQGKASWNFSGNQLRKGLLLFQFLISILVISGVMVINQQMNFIKNQGLGFTEDPIVVLPRISNNSNYLMRLELQDEPGIQGIASLSSIPGYRDPRGRNIKENGTTGDGINANGIWVSEEYAEIIDIEFLAGRNFTIDDQENTVILNEKAVTDLGWEIENALGKRIVMTGRDGFDPTTYEVLGVIEDYNYQSMYEQVAPLFLRNNSKSRSGGDASIVKISKARFEESLAAIQNVWTDIEKAQAFDYYFLDDALNEVYQKEMKLSKTVNYVSGISILICFLGLFGLVSLTLESRRKEIGIRQVLGASGKTIARLLSSSYTRIIGLSIVIGAPISYYLLDQWLSNFAYRVDYSFTIYFAVGLGTLLLSIVLVGSQSIHASKTNPVESLRED